MARLLLPSEKTKIAALMGALKRRARAVGRFEIPPRCAARVYVAWFDERNNLKPVEYQWAPSPDVYPEHQKGVDCERVRHEELP